MKSNSLLFILVLALTFTLIFAVWNVGRLFTAPAENGAPSSDASFSHTESCSAVISDTSEFNTSAEGSTCSAEIFSSSQEETSDCVLSSMEPVESPESSDTAELPEESAVEQVLGKKLERYSNIVNNGIYKFKFTRQRIIGGHSVPVVTTVWFGEGYVNIVEAEMHNISTEVFINKDGAYMLNIGENSADLLSADAIDVPCPTFSNLTFLCEGFTNIGDTIYDYERYMDSDGVTVDYLFSDGVLKKAKIYTNKADYEIFNIEISDDISDGRDSLPPDLNITDRR